MEIFKKNSKYSLEDVFNRHKELSKYEDEKRIEPRKNESTFRNGDTKREEKFRRKSFSEKDYSYSPVGSSYEILNDNSILVLRPIKKAILSGLFFSLFLILITVLTAFSSNGTRHEGDSLPWPFFALISAYAFYQAAKSALGCNQINFSKKLELFWFGPYFSNRGDIKGSIRCKNITELKKITCVYLRKETRKSKNGSYYEYCVYLGYSEKEYLGLKLFDNRNRGSSKYVAEQIAQFLSIEMKEE